MADKLLYFCRRPNHKHYEAKNYDNYCWYYEQQKISLRIN